MEILFIYKFDMCTKSDRFTFSVFIGTGGGGGGMYKFLTVNALP